MQTFVRHGSNGLQFFKASGEFREPKKGEFYLSGSIVEVWLAQNDLGTKYWIAVPTDDPPQTIEAYGLIYRRDTYTRHTQVRKP